MQGKPWSTACCCPRPQAGCLSLSFHLCEMGMGISGFFWGECSFLIKVYLIYTLVSIFAAPQSDPVRHIHTFFFSYHRPSWPIPKDWQSSLCCTAGWNILTAPLGCPSLCWMPLPTLATLVLSREEARGSLSCTSLASSPRPSTWPWRTREQNRHLPCASPAWALPQRRGPQISG